MTDEAFQIAVDAVIRKAPLHTSFGLYAFMSSNLIDGNSNLTQEIRGQVMYILLHRDQDVFNFLLKEKYFRIENQSTKYVVMTDKGEKAKELGGHQAYLSWEADVKAAEQIEKERLDKLQRKINWPQKNWWVLLILSAIIFPIITGLILEARRNKTSPNIPPIPRTIDTFYISRTDTIYRIDTVAVTSKAK